MNSAETTRSSFVGTPRRFTVKVTPRAGRDEVLGIRDGLLRVKLRAPPVDGAANEALRELLAEHFAVKRSQVQILRGEKARIKMVEIAV